jgi:4-amino-4-deoxychorismate lyase
MKGVFTTIRIVDGHPEYYEKHLTRLQQHCKILGLSFPKIENNIPQKSGVWRFRITVTEQGYTTDHQPYTPPTSPIKVGFYKQEKEPFYPKVKSLETLQRKSILANKKFDDYIVLSPEGYVLECVFANIFWVQEENLFTPDPVLPLMFGLTIQEIVAHSKNVHFVKTKNIPTDAKLFACNSMQGIVPLDF